MQIICQNAQQQNVYLLVPLVNLIGQNKLPLINKNRNGRINVKFGKSITWVLLIQKLCLIAQIVQQAMIYKFMSFYEILDLLLVLVTKNK